MSTTNLNYHNDDIKIFWANWFITRGYAVFLISPQSKVPPVPEWQNTKPIVNSEEKEKFLNKLKEGYNYAVLAGVNNLVILDVEDKQLFTRWIGGELALNKLCEKTLCVDTPHGGIHVYFKAPDVPPHKFNPVFIQGDKNVADLQSVASYVVGPGSTINHKNCKSDKCPWRGQDKEDMYVPHGLTEIRELKSLKEFLIYLEERGKALGISLAPTARAWVYGKRTDNGGNVNAEKLFARLKKEDEGKEVGKVRKEICEEIDDYDNEIDRKVARALCHNKTYREVGLKERSNSDWRAILILFRHGLFDPDKILQILPLDSKAKVNEKWKSNSYFVLTLKNAWKAYKRTNQTTGAQTKSEKIDIVKSVVTDLIMKKYKIATFYDPRTDAVIGVSKWSKKKGIYEPYDNRLRRAIREEVESLGVLKITDKSLFHISKRVVEDIYAEIRDKTLTPLPADPPRVAFANVTIDWTGRKIEFVRAEERTPAHFAFNYVPHTVYIDSVSDFLQKNKEITIEAIEEFARAHCPKSLETFKQWAGERWVLLYELIGYSLYLSNEFKKAFVVLGPRDSGKSTFLRLLGGLLGHDNVSSVNISELLDPNNRFVVGALYHKLINVASEAKEYTLKDTERLKALTGEDTITVDRKYKDPFQFRPYAKIIVSTNELPYVQSKTDDAFWSRWVVIPFNNQFPRNAKWYAETFTEQEMNGILSTAIIALARVFQRSQFDFEQCVKEIKDIWLSQKDSVYQFMSRALRAGIIEITKNADDHISTGKLYTLYRNYCLDRGLSAVGLKKFVSRVREYYGITRMQKKIEDKRVRVFVCVRLFDTPRAVQIMNDIDEFTAFVKKYSHKTVTFDDIVKELGQERANAFLELCLHTVQCVKRSDLGENVYEILRHERE